MTEVDQMLPVIKNSKTDLIVNSFINYFKEKWKLEICEKLKTGYSDMSQINLTLAEMGLEEDMNDLFMYESELGCEKSDS